ncbi:MAG: 16S rRNA (cytosine(967)-C(5))-methyltransferase RsmB [Lachnospiraceae bacterium]|nr:16S rRNA (cytosine(967)-C(5))-methyltransferase RsmB [Lachnospiraceae bacterium]
MTDVRIIAYEALLDIENNRSPLAGTKDVLAKYSYLDKNDRGFLKRLIEGTIERRITIDYVLDLYSKVPVTKMKKQIRTILRMGTYQILYMDVADFAAVNETVKLAKKKGFSSLSGFVNGVLRNILRNRHGIAWPEKGADIIKYMSVMYSCPEWIVKKLIDEQGESNAGTLLELSVSVRPVTARVNLSKTTVSEALKGCNGRASDVCGCAIVLEDYDTVPDIPAFADGRICIQDISSMLVGIVAGIGINDTVLDLCAAPGGKSLHAADIAGSGRVIALDVSENKVAGIRENVARCGFTNVDVSVADATVYNSEFYEIADVVIADVPCSGLGVMGRKNDIKYNLTEDSIRKLTELQRSILSNAVRYVKPGGVLMFSTCTCSYEENQGNMRFLTDECGLTPVDFYDLMPDRLKCASAKEGYVQLYGSDALTDGFFIGKLLK